MNEVGELGGAVGAELPIRCKELLAHCSQDLPEELPEVREHPLFRGITLQTEAPEKEVTDLEKGWLVELERRLDPDDATQPHPTGRRTRRPVEELLAHLEQHALSHPGDAAVVTHICATFRQRWPRLFACSAWPERYRTNNDLATFFGRLRTRHRQIQGRKSVPTNLSCGMAHGPSSLTRPSPASRCSTAFSTSTRLSLIEGTPGFGKPRTDYKCWIGFALSLGAVSHNWGQQWAEVVYRKSR
jgi:hypothetical protein